MQQDIPYGIRLFILYGMIWFIDLLDATLLNLALPVIAKDFQISPNDAQWALIVFLVAMVIGMILSTSFSQKWGLRPVFLGVQWIYIFSSLACGLAQSLGQLILYRFIQGLAGGVAMPLGMFLTMSILPHHLWVKVGAWTSLCTVFAPAMGPIMAGYLTHFLHWRWLFFFKLPISLIAVLLSHFWVKHHVEEPKKNPFDWIGFILATASLTLFLLGMHEIGKPDTSTLRFIIFFVLSFGCGVVFLWQERRAKCPLIPLKIFHNPMFTWGNVIQTGANMVFLTSFLIALYFQSSLNFSIITSGWIMATITLGMMSVLPLTAKFYNKWGPLPFIIPGLLLLSGSMFSLIFVTPQTPSLIIACIIFCQGAGVTAVKNTNFISIFSGVPKRLKSPASSLYSILKQIGASLGIVITTVALTLSMDFYGIPHTSHTIPQKAFYIPYAILGTIPLLALICCLGINNKKAIRQHASHDHLESEFEEGVE